MQTCPICKAQNANVSRFCITCGEPQLGFLAFGTVLRGRYRIDDLLGVGSFSAVYLATDLQKHILTVLKENFHPKFRQAFLSEAHLIIALNHPNLPKVIDYFLEFIGNESRRYMVVEFIQGESLDVLVPRRGHLSESEALTLLKDVFDVISCLHSQKPPIIHRDIKPKNIIMTKGNKVMLVDIGIAKVSVTLRKAATGIYSEELGFAPPEQFASNAVVDEQTDIYSLAATLYFCLTGHVPPQAPNLAAGVDILMPLRKLNPNVSKEVEIAIEKGMALQKSERFKSVEEFWTALTNP